MLTWKHARIIAAQHAARIDLPRRLDGAEVQIADYDDEGTLRFLKHDEPDLSLRDQQMINQAFARECRKRGARVRLVPVTVRDYFDWIADHRLVNTPGNRAQYVSWLTCGDPKFTPR